ncbi:MAG: DEAD/DEAH box helicase [Planctomycetes bacterium]|nr:DEAD/DEAH box helicase [Planctomycetota bacterium]
MPSGHGPTTPPPSEPAADPFAQVPGALRPALHRKGFTRLTPVQQAVLEADRGERDLRITSQTGSGKTVALGFALAARLATPGATGPCALCIAPTRELAMQLGAELAWLYADLPSVHCEVVTGGTSVRREQMQLRHRPRLVVGTPGRLLDHVRSGCLDLSSVQQLVLDEADQMLDLGFKDELDALLEAMPAERRTHLVSATFPAAVRALADRCQKDALHIAGTAADQSHGDIEHIALKIGARDHYAALVNLLLLAGDERTLVFVRTREDTSSLADKLAADGFLALPIHGDLAQAQRTRTLEAFRRGTIHTLIATDVAARGLDIQDVRAVVHVDPPIDAATYVHRSGRTGRAGQKGRSYQLVVKSREQRTRRLYQLAKVTAVWAAAPTPDEVVARQWRRAAALAETVLAQNPEPAADHRAVAAALLAGRDATAVVAALLERTAAGVREPMPVATPKQADGAGRSVFAEPAGEPAVAKVAVAKVAAAKVAAAAPSPPPEVPSRKAAAETTAHPAPEAATPAVDPPAPSRRLAASQRGSSKAPPSWKRPPADAPAGHPGATGGFVRFRINWGTRDGAEPRRILAHVCRRGEIESHQVGAIRLQPFYATFEVQAAVAAGFARKVAKPDRRDPGLAIVRDGDRPR